MRQHDFKNVMNEVAEEMEPRANRSDGSWYHVVIVIAVMLAFLISFGCASPAQKEAAIAIPKGSGLVWFKDGSWKIMPRAQAKRIERQNRERGVIYNPSTDHGWGQ